MPDAPDPTVVDPTVAQPARARSRLVDLGTVVLGWLLILAGVPLLPLPGPGMVVIVAGVALLARRYVWAQRILDPLQARAVEAGRASVASVPRIIVSALGGVWLCVLGVLWWSSPEISEFDVVGVHLGPRLPFAGRGTAIGLFASAVAAWALVAYSVRRFR